MLNFEYEQLNLHNKQHLACLKALFEDSAMKENFYVYDMFQAFDEFIVNKKRWRAERTQQIVCSNGKCIGWIEIICNNAENLNQLCIAYAVVPKERSKGYATRIVNDIFVMYPNHDEYIAEILETNKNSERVAAACGFQKSLHKFDDVNIYIKRKQCS